jgi:hypothetical protein
VPPPARIAAAVSSQAARLREADCDVTADAASAARHERDAAREIEELRDPHGRQGTQTRSKTKHRARPKRAVRFPRSEPQASGEVTRPAGSRSIA